MEKSVELHRGGVVEKIVIRNNQRVFVVTQSTEAGNDDVLAVFSVWEAADAFAKKHEYSSVWEMDMDAEVPSVPWTNSAAEAIQGVSS